MLGDLQLAARRVGRFMLDALGPHHCVRCGRIGAVVCADCWNTVPQHMITTPGPEPLLAITSAADYEQPIIKQLIHDLKYDGIQDAAEPLGKLLAEVYAPMQQPVDVLVPVSLHTRRKRFRGFNQSELLAQRIPGANVAHILTRVRYTKPQVECGKDERRTNLRDAFHASVTTAKRIILVDDVTTTGTTFAEAAKALRNVTTAPIIGLAVARGG